MLSGGLEASFNAMLPTGAEAVISEIPITLPDDSQRGLAGWPGFNRAVPLAIGAGLIGCFKQHDGSASPSW
jgi:hypothetical protein